MNYDWETRPPKDISRYIVEGRVQEAEYQRFLESLPLGDKAFTPESISIFH